MPSVDVVTSQISYGETGVARTLFLSCPGGVVDGKEISQASSHIIEAQGKKESGCLGTEIFLKWKRRL